MPIPSVSKISHFAQFATSSRLLSCLVTEGLLSAYILPVPSHSVDQLKALCVIIYDHVSFFKSSDIHSVIPLKEVPVLETSLSSNSLYKVKLLDPMDMLPAIYTLTSRMSSENTLWLGHEQANWKQLTFDYLLTKLPELSSYQLNDYIDGAKLWSSFAKKIDVPEPLMEQIAMELNSSITNQKYIYEHPRSLPSFNSPSIEWERCVFEGHATHPMHKARYTVPPMPVITGDVYDLANPTIRVAAVPRSSMKLRGDFESLLQPLLKAMFHNSLDIPDSSEYVLVPVHELQLPNINHFFGDVIVLPSNISTAAEALTSLRSIVVRDALPEFSLKLCLGMKVSSALRTITPFTTYFGPGFSKNVVPKLTVDPSVLQIERELASACYEHNDFNVAKHCSCVVREAFENTSEERGERVIVCAALVEKCQSPDSSTSLVEHVWGLDSDAKKVEFLDSYTRLALEAFLPPCIHNGVAFEAHGQNTLARFDIKTKKLLGFVIRDFGGIKVHRETLRQSCGAEIDVLPDSCVVAEDPSEVYKLLYHTLIFSHLHRLIRVLGLHHDGRGWAMVRQHLKNMIPNNHPLWTTWMCQAELPGKCLMQMKIDELYRDYIYRDIPNLILYEPQPNDLVDVPVPSGLKSNIVVATPLTSQ